MMRILFVVLFICFSLSAVAIAGENDRKSKILKVINEELSEIVRLNKQTRGRNSKLLIRMAELMLEKGNIVREKENDAFMALSPKKRQRISKKKIFKKSNKYFKQAEKTCHYILKRFKHLKEKSEIYYILAFNAKESRNHRKAENYFRKSMNNSRVGTEVYRKSQVALAEMYFNSRKFKKAIPLYEQSLRRKKNKWWTKDSYNLAWCYFRLGKTNKAISKMKEVHRIGKSSKYVDMSASVEKNLAYFYSEAGRIKEAISFYKRKGTDVSSSLRRLSVHLADKGNHQAAERILKEARRYKKDKKEDVEILISLLVLYEKTRKYDKHLKISQQLLSCYKKGLLSKNHIETVKYHAQKMSATLQKHVVGKTYKHRKKMRNKRALGAVEYFRILNEMDPGKSYQANFNSAETLYSAGEYNKAIQYYDLALKGAQAAGNRKVQKLASNGLMASLGKKGVTNANKEKYRISVYLAFLKSNPKSKKSYKIFQRIFSSYCEKKDFKSAEKILIRFKRYFPKALKTQEAMLAKIMDHHKDKGDRAAIQAWVNRIKRGEFKVSRKYGKKLKLLLITMQFEGVEKASSKGDKKTALKGYVSIYGDSGSSKEAKKNAAYNIAILFHELGYMEYTARWTGRALSLMTMKDVLKFQDSFMAIGTALFNRGYQEQAVNIYETTFDKICRSKSKNKKLFFKNAYVIQLADDGIDRARKLVGKAFRCNIPASFIKEARLDIIKTMHEIGRWDSLEEELKRVESYKNMWPDLIEPLYALYTAYIRSGRTSFASKVRRKINNYYNHCKARKMDIPVEALDIVAKFRLAGLNGHVKALKSIKLGFPENVYNKVLQRKFKKLDIITAKAVNIFKIGSGNGIVKSYGILVDSYRGLATEIRSFKPAGKSKDYLTSFRKSMIALTAPILKKANDFSREAKRQIMANDILAKDGYKFLTNLSYPITLEYNYLPGGVIMDRGGKK